MVECYVWRKRTINLEYNRVIAYFLLRCLIEDFRLWFFYHQSDNNNGSENKD